MFYVFLYGCIRFYIIFQLILFSGVGTIQITEQSIPSNAIRGEDISLECLYDLQGDSLYSVKWYRNGQVSIFLLVVR